MSRQPCIGRETAQPVGLGCERDPSSLLDSVSDGGGGSGEGRGSCPVISYEGEVLVGDPGTGSELLAQGEACCLHQPAGADACRAVGEVVYGSALRAQA